MQFVCLHANREIASGSGSIMQLLIIEFAVRADKALVRIIEKAYYDRIRLNISQRIIVGHLTSLAPEFIAAEKSC